jgi:hypothetical protein
MSCDIGLGCLDVGQNSLGMKDSVMRYWKYSCLDIGKNTLGSGYGTLRHSVMIYWTQLPEHGAKYPLCNVILDTVASAWDKVPYTSNYCKCHVLLDTIALTRDKAPWVCNMQ